MITQELNYTSSDDSIQCSKWEVLFSLHSKNISFFLRSCAQINSHHVPLPEGVLKQIIAKSSHHKLPQCSWLSANINKAWQVYGVSTITDLPRQMVPLPTYPGLQVQLCPLMVLVQIAFSSQLCCPLPHSSCSKWGEEKGKKKNLQDAVRFSVSWCGSIWKPRGINQDAPMAACWGLGMGISYGLASVQKLSMCMATVDYLGLKIEKKKKRIGEEAKNGCDKTLWRWLSGKNICCED